jgi:hypothetical protein
VLTPVGLPLEVSVSAIFFADTGLPALLAKKLAIALSKVASLSFLRFITSFTRTVL